MTIIQDKSFILETHLTDLINDPSVQEENTLIFRNCTFTSTHKTLLDISSVSSVIFDKCTFSLNVQEFNIFGKGTHLSFTNSTFDSKDYRVKVNIYTRDVTFKNSIDLPYCKDVHFDVFTYAVIEDHKPYSITVHNHKNITFKNIHNFDTIKSVLNSSVVDNIYFNHCTVDISLFSKYTYNNVIYSFYDCTIIESKDNEEEFSVESLTFYGCTFNCSMDFLYDLTRVNVFVLEECTLSSNKLPYINGRVVEIERNTVPSGTLYFKDNKSFLKLVRQILYIQQNECVFDSHYFDGVYTELRVHNTPLESNATLSSNGALMSRTPLILYVVGSNADTSKFDTSRLKLYHHHTSDDHRDTIFHYTYNNEDYIYCAGFFNKVVSHHGNIYKVEELRGVDHYKRFLYVYEYAPSLGKHFYNLNDIEAFLKDQRDLEDTISRYTLDTPIPKEEAIELYRLVTYACEPGIDSFFARKPELQGKTTFTLEEILTYTEGEYGHSEFKKIVDKCKQQEGH